MQVLPFAVLLGGMLCFWRLTRSSELIVARAAGVSAWEFLAAPTLCALLFGMLATTAVSPLSSVMFGRAEAMDNTYLKTGGGPLALTGGQLWLRQSDHALVAAGCRHHPCARCGTARQAVDRVAGQRVPSGWPATGCSPGSRRREATLGARRMAVAECPCHSAGADAGTVRRRSACRPTLPWRACRRASPRRIRCRSGHCPTSSRCWTARDSRRSATGCIFRRCSRCRCSARRWRWSPPDSPCVRRGAAAWHR